MAEAVAERWVKHPVAKVWRALSEPKLAAAWLPFEGYRPEVGHRFVARGPTGPADCEVTVVEAPHRVVCSWREGGQATTVAIELSEDTGGTRVVVRHAASERRRKELHLLWLTVLQGGLDAVLVTGTASVVGGAAVTGTGLAVGIGVGVLVVGAVLAGVFPRLGAEQTRTDAPPMEAVVAPGVPTPVAFEERQGPVEPADRNQPLLPPMRRDEIVSVYDAWPTTLHPLYPSNEADVRVQRLVWAPLFYRSPITNEITSDLVASSSVEGHRLVVTLEPGHTFHDGHPITAEDVCYSVGVVIDRSRPVNLPASRRGDLLGCEVKGPLVASLRLRTPMPDARLRVSVPVLPAHAFDPSPYSEVATRPVGSGPYQAFMGRREIRLSAMDAASGLPGLAIQEGGDPIVQVRTLQRGGVHGLIEVPPSSWPELAAHPELLLETWQPRVLVYLATNPSTLGDQGLRRRIAQAIDRQELLRMAYGPDVASGPMAPPKITGPFLMSSPLYNRAVQPTAVVRDPTPSGRKLRLGFAKGRWVVRAAADSLVLQLGAAGIRVQAIAAEEPDPALHDLWLGTWQVDSTDDPSPMLVQGPLGARSDAVDALLVRLRDAATHTEQQDVAHELHRVVAEEAQWIGLFEDVRRSAWRVGIRMNVISPYDYWGALDGWEVAAVE